MKIDYGQGLEFGYFLIPNASDPAGVVETARLVDRLGYDLVGVQDHPYQPHHFDTLALLGAILTQTTSLRVFADVGNLPLRPPAVLAKAAAALEEAVAIMRAMWSAERRGLPFEGRQYHLNGASPGPAPAHPIQIWIGLMNYKPPRDAAQGNLVIDRAACEAGRDPREIRRIYNIPGAFTRTPQNLATDSDQATVGPPEQWADVLTHFALDLGVSTFVLAIPSDPETLATFIERVAPQVRQRVARRRASPPSPKSTRPSGSNTNARRSQL